MNESQSEISSIDVTRPVTGDGNGTDFVQDPVQGANLAENYRAFKKERPGLSGLAAKLIYGLRREGKQAPNQPSQNPEEEVTQ